ncbi:uncharacterized protein LOC142330388 [Lycorma delicatula]|uniref:uncharacterized protein LOC142330388 n=1 Tax=Lycorma delicatula TaxID=130591 RepID=UPI003F517BBD
MAEVFRKCKIIIWDECTMAHKHSFEALDRTLKDLIGQVVITVRVVASDGNVLRKDGDNAATNEEDEEDEDQEASHKFRVQEHDFSFNDFVNRFVNYKAVEICTMLLSQFEKNTAYTNHCVIKLLHRIAWDCKLPAMVFQASMFRIFQRALESRNPEHKEIQKFGKFIIQQFIEISKKNRHAFLELLFWKKFNEAKEIIEGYGTYVKTYSSRNMWTEEQEDELRRLFEEYQRDNPGPNVIDWIMMNIINQERSRRIVLKKMRELGLIQKDFRLTKSNSTRNWTDDEVTQLKELVPKFLEADNPIDCIMLSLEGDRSKKSVIQKCIELHLISDKSELSKKKIVKPRSKKKNNDSDLSGDDVGGTFYYESIDSSESDNDTNLLTTPRTQRKLPSKPKKSKKSKKNDNISSNIDVVNALNKCVEAGFHEPLEWLITSLLETIEDLDDDDETGIPLLPITEECIKSMEDKVFLEMLTGIGINCPSSEQEMYWRIPGTWKESDIRSKVDKIRDAIDGKLVSHVEETENFEKAKKQKPKKKKSKDSKKSEKFKDIIESINRNNDSTSEEENSSDDVNDELNLSDQISDEENNSSINLPSTSENNLEVTKLNNNSNKKKKKKKHNQKHLKTLMTEILTDSDNDDEPLNHKRKHNLNHDFDSDVHSSDNDEISSKDLSQKKSNCFDSNNDNGYNEKENIFTNLNNMSNSLRINDEQFDQNETKPDEENISVNIKSDMNNDKSKRKRLVTSDSSGNDSDSDTVLLSDNIKKKKKRIIVNSDSEADDENNHMDISEVSFSNTVDGSDNTESKANEKLIVADKSGQNNNEIPSQSSIHKKKKKAVIDSSSDEEIC